jgi:hypothetical protein
MVPPLLYLTPTKTTKKRRQAMGLDNIPSKYPCETRGTAVKVVRQYDDGTNAELIDCEATMEAWQCPWQEALSKANLPEEAKPTYGMLGCPCWYRGKWGNFVISAIGAGYEEPHQSFYGDMDDGCYKTPESCIETAEAIENAVANIETGFIPMPENNTGYTETELLADAKYASWWLRWAAEEASGSACWY